MSDRPYLSVVATARNDDHGGNPLYRTQLFVDGLVAQADRFELPTELVLVEWNPPADRPRLAEVLEWPSGRGYCAIRILEVPHELHATLEYSDRLPLFQMIGKNVGIRRAKGELVLATNIDILFSDELMRYLASGRVRAGHVYTADRFDVPAEIDPTWPLDRQLEFCARNAIRVHRREGTLDLRDGTFYRIHPAVSLRARVRNSQLGVRLLRSPLARRTGVRWLVFAHPAPDAGLLAQVRRSRLGGLIGLGRATRVHVLRAKALSYRVYAFAYWLGAGFNDPRQVPRRILRLADRIDRLAAAAVAPADAATAAGPRAARTALGVARLPARLVVGLARLSRARWRETERSVVDELARIRLHTNACGDFTLMAKTDWLKTGGYAELEMYSMHIDGLQLYIAHYSGITERFLPFPVFHIEHGGGFRPEAKGDESLDSTLSRRAIPQITNAQLMDYIRTMYHDRAPLRVNGVDWGFAAESLVETEPQRTPALAGTNDRGDT